VRMIKLVNRRNGILHNYETRHMDDRVVQSASHLQKEIMLQFDASTVKEGVEGILGKWFLNIGPVDSSVVDNHVVFRTLKNGIGRSTIVDETLLRSPGFLELVKINNRLLEIGTPPFTIIKNSQNYMVSNLREAAQKVMDEAKKGYALQRYKGLGEMNPEQLWDTTMDPEKRFLVQVSIEDAIETDSIFTTLMGDDVEQRRNFIQSNALRVSNLDI